MAHGDGYLPKALTEKIKDVKDHMYGGFRSVLYDEDGAIKDRYHNQTG